MRAKEWVPGNRKVIEKGTYLPISLVMNYITQQVMVSAL
jgi:hypothetical protein